MSVGLSAMGLVSLPTWVIVGLSTAGWDAGGVTTWSTGAFGLVISLPVRVMGKPGVHTWSLSVWPLMGDKFVLAGDPEPVIAAVLDLVVIPPGPWGISVASSGGITGTFFI